MEEGATTAAKGGTRTHGATLPFAGAAWLHRIEADARRRLDVAQKTHLRNRRGGLSALLADVRDVLVPKLARAHA